MKKEAIGEAIDMAGEFLILALQILLIVAAWCAPFLLCTVALIYIIKVC